jgi:outer membrane protein insertion porin family
MRTTWIWVMLLLTGMGCRTARYIPEGEKLYTGAEINWTSAHKVEGKAALRSEVEDLLHPNPNTTFMGARPGLWAHYRKEAGKAGPLARFLYKKYGEEPVYLSQVQPDRTLTLINNRLENRGYFFSVLRKELREDARHARIRYYIDLPEPYRLMTYHWVGDSTRTLERTLVDAMRKNTLLPPGTRYDLDKLKAERERIDRALKNQGYYNFHPDFLLFRADTNQYKTKGFDLYLSVKSATPASARHPYRVKEVKVYPNYQVDNGDTLRQGVVVEGVEFIQSTESFKPHLLREYVLIAPGNPYTLRHHTLTSNRLAGIGNFRFVNIRYYPEDSLQLDSDGYGSLQAGIYLSPLNRQSMRVELQALSKSNNFVGPNLLMTYRNRNTFRGGETFGITGKFGYETQFSGGERTGLNSFELGVEADLVYPRLIAPIHVKQRVGYSVPKTRIALAYTILERVQLYRLNSLQGSFGYQWNSSRYASHEVYPLSLNFVGVSRTSAEFEEILAGNPFLQRSFDQQFIAGLTYAFQFSQLSNTSQLHRYFVRFNIDLAGNTLSALNALGGESGSDLFLGEPYARYSRFDLDLRHYFRTSKETRLITRAFAGVGLPHGGQASLPFIKQFFAGGPNSIRAFRIRSLGPGTYRPEEVTLSSFFDQSGDVKVEANMEYRFPMISYLKGAVFADAGNVWLLNENEALPGSQFTGDWFRQLALGVGVGFRLDFEFFVIRLDLATPLRNPAEVANPWQRTFRPLERSWRQDFLVWNFGIGYPF